MLKGLPAAYAYYFELVNDKQSLICTAMVALISVYSYYYLVLLPVHECGHLIFGLCTGYHPVILRILFIAFVYTEHGIQIRRCFLSETDGQCIMKPPEYLAEKHPFALYMLGGVILDAVSSGILLLLSSAFYCKQFHLSLLLLIFSFLEFLNFLLNLVPYKLSGLNNDGMNTWIMIRNRKAIESWYAVAHIYCGLNSGLHYQEFPPSLYHLPENMDLDNDLIATHKMNEAYYHMSNQEWNKALDNINDIISYGSRTMKKLASVELLFLYIFLKKDSSEISHLYEEVKKLLCNASELQIKKVSLAYQLHRDSSETNKIRIKKRMALIRKTSLCKGEVDFCMDLVSVMIDR